jgi:hypothetical protein
MADEKVFILSGGRMAPDATINPDNVPSTDQKAALAGTSGTPPDGTNKLVDNADSRMTDTRAPLSHGNEAHSSTFITSTDVTYEALNTNGDVGAVASTVAAGDDARFLTSDQKAAAAGEGTPSASNKYACKDYVDLAIDGLDWQEGCEYHIHFKGTGTNPTCGEVEVGWKKLDTTNHEIETASAGSTWGDTVILNAGDRIIWKDDGVACAGDGYEHVSTDKIYRFTGSSYDEITPSKSMVTNVEDEGSGGTEYVYNGTDWVSKASGTTHNGLSGKQGGAADEYYHITADQEAGMDAAADAITASNPILTKADKVRMPDRIAQVRRGGVGQSQSNVVMYDSNDLRGSGVRMHKAGYIVGLVVQSSGAPTAGTLTAKPHVNGTAITPTGLNTQLSSGTQDNHSNVAEGVANYNFAAGAKVGALLDTDVSWAAGGSEDISVDVLVVFTG